ncbi:MAG: YihY/virulence factor BrkB family protein [Longibaculum sp.]
MKRFYEKCVKIYDDYRAVVPPYAAAALSFYLILILIPAFSLVAVGTSLLNIDMSLIEDIISHVIMPEYSQMLIDILESKSVNTVALVTMIVSVYTVSRGVGNIYEISKNMYQQHIEESIVGYYIYTFKITIFILLIFIGFIMVLAMGPLAYIFNTLYNLFGFRHIFLYFLLVFCLMSIYMIVPRIRIHHADAFQGALVASALMLVLYYGLNIYFRFADFESVYGPLAFIVVILFVFDWAAEIFYIGMYMTNILHLRRINDEKRTSRN